MYIYFPYARRVHIKHALYIRVRKVCTFMNMVLFVFNPESTHARICTRTESANSLRVNCPSGGMPTRFDGAGVAGRFHSMLRATRIGEQIIVQ